MTRQFVLRRQAEQDIRSAFEWYESERHGLGDEFLVKVKERLEAIREHPDSCPILYRQVRRAVVSRFPYVIFYLTLPGKVTVLAVLHQYRSPAAWPMRGRSL